MRYVVNRTVLGLSVMVMLGMLSGPALGAATADSSTWTTYSYDGSYKPITAHPELWMGGFGTTPDESDITIQQQTDIAGCPNPLPGDYSARFAGYTNSKNLYYFSASSVPFNFATGATMEWRILPEYGNVNEQAFMGMGDLTASKLVWVDYKFSNGGPGYPDGTATNNVLHPLAGGLSSGFHIVRATVLGDVVTTYLDNNPTPISVTTTLTYPGVVTPNGIAFGTGGIIANFDYIRWTNEGAFAPVPEPVTLVLLGLGGLMPRRRS